jgi:hypothetical protein
MRKLSLMIRDAKRLMEDVHELFPGDENRELMMQIVRIASELSTLQLAMRLKESRDEEKEPTKPTVTREKGPWTKLDGDTFIKEYND